MDFITFDNATPEQVEEFRKAWEESVHTPLTLPSVTLVSVSKLTYFIAVEPDWYEGHYEARELAYVFRTEASLTRTKRYCRVMGWDLIAYGEMQVFGDTEYLSADDMRLDVRKKAEDNRERRREHARWMALTDEEREAERKAVWDKMTYRQKLMYQLEKSLLWGNIERTPSTAPMYEWKGIAEMNGVKVNE